MTPAAFTLPVNLGALCILLALAVRSDILWHRIPNIVTGLGLAVGLVLQSTLGGWRGAGEGVLGASAGCAVLLPFYLMRGMGAGDVKLASAAGSFLGPAGALIGAFVALIVGALCAVIWLISTRIAGERDFATPSEVRKRKFPYALPIAIGMLGSGVARWLG